MSGIVCAYEVRTDILPLCSHSKRIMIVDLDLKREKSILHLSETIQNSMFDPRSRDISKTVRVKGKTVLVRCRGCIVLLCPERGRIARVVINNVSLGLNQF